MSSIRRALTAGAGIALALGATGAAAMDMALKFALDWKFEGPSAAYFVALDKGYYKAEGLDVTIDSGKGSVDGINRVASGVYPMGFADLNSLVKFRDKNPDKAVKSVMNTSGTAIDLFGVQFESGIEFAFGESDIVLLAPGERIVLSANDDAFRTRYAGQEPDGQYSDQLSNDVETLRLVDRRVWPLAASDVIRIRGDPNLRR